MLLKSKSLIVVLVLVLACAVGGTFIVTQNIAENQAFEQDGFIVKDKAENDEGGYNTVQATFAAGESFQTNYQHNHLTFQDTSDEKQSVENYGFVHYQDGSAIALKPGVLVDLDKIQPKDMSAFNIEPNTQIVNNGSSYGVEHMGETVPLESVLWKLSADKMMVMGTDLSLQLSEGDPYLFKDFVEVNYIDDGVMQISDAETTVLTISPVAQLTVNNGPVVDLYNQVAVNDEAQLPLSHILVGDDDYTDITAVKEEALESVTIPTFTVIQGTDGAGGTPGTSGERGASGDNGSSGSEGASGSSGAGTDPDEDGSGGQVQVEQFTKPIVEMREFNYNSVSVSGSVAIDDEEGKLVDGSVLLRIVDTETGATVHEIPNVNGGIVGKDNPWPFAYEPLVPGKTYKLTISAKYLGPDGQEYSADFITKTIVADEVGLQLKKDTVTSTTIDVNLYKEAFSGATQANLVLYNKDGVIQNSITKVLTAGDNVVQFVGLTPNTTYYVGVENVSVSYSDGSSASSISIDNYGSQLEITTLQNFTDYFVDKPRVFGNNPNMTISAQAGDIKNILLSSITSYRYEFWLLTNPVEPALVLSSATNGPVLANVSPSPTNTNPTLLNWNTEYKVKLILEVDDNEKIVEYESDFSDPVGLFGNLYPIITYVPNSGDSAFPQQYEWAIGVLNINPNGGDVFVDATRPLDVIFESTTTSHTITVPFSDLSSIPHDSAVETTSQRRNPFVLPINQKYLQQDTAYKVTVFGFADTDALSSTPPVRIAFGTFSIKTPDSLLGSLHMKNTDTAPAGHSFGVELWLQDYSSSTPFEYEASNLGYVELGLYFGVLQENDTNRQPDRTILIASSNTTPGLSTLGPNRDDNLNYSGIGYLYSPSGTPGGFVEVPASGLPSGPATGGLLITEESFGLTAQQAAAYSTMTIMVERVVDYTASAPAKNIFVNTFDVVNSEAGMRVPTTDNPNNGIDLYTAKTAPPPPDNGAAFTAKTISEVERSGYLPNMTSDSAGALPLGGDVRDQYDPSTVVGLNAKSTFPSPELADTFTYTLWRTKTDPNGDNSPALINTAANEPTDGLVDETADANREKVFDVVLPVYKSGSLYQTPTLNVGFGYGNSVLPAGNEGGSNVNNDYQYFVYLASMGAGSSPGQRNPDIDYNSETDGRGYHYYFTYTADLTAKLGDPDAPGEYIYPRDYKQTGSTIDYTKLQLTSKRLSAPKQSVQFKMWPSTSHVNGNNETWKYRMTVLDTGTLTDAQGASITDEKNQIHVVNEDPANLLPTNMYPVSVSAISGNGYEALTLNPLYDNSPFTLTYYEKTYAHSVFGSSATDPLTAQHEKLLLSSFHRSELKKVDAESLYGDITVFSNTARNAIFVSYPTMTAAALTNIAGVWVTVTPEAGGIRTWTSLLDIKMDNPDPLDTSKQYISAEIPLARLSESGFVANEEIKIEAKILFDTGKSGWDVLAGSTEGFAIQSQGPDAVGAGTYQLPGSIAGTYAASSNATGGAFLSASKTDPVGESGVLSLDIASPWNGSYTYQSAMSLLFKGTQALEFTNGGSRFADSNTYVTAKRLDVTDSEVESTTMPAIIPQVSEYSASPNASGADIRFFLEGAAGVLKADPTMKYNISLVEVNPNGKDVVIDTNWGGGFEVIDKGTNSFSFTGLKSGTTYRFRIYGLFAAPLDAAVTPVFDNGTAYYYFYDTAQQSSGREYVFTTIGEVDIGGKDDLAFSADFDAQSYSNKFLKLTYDLSLTRGFKLHYYFTDKTAGGSLDFESPLGVYTTRMVENIPIGGQSASYNSFFIPGHEYEVTIKALSNTGSSELGTFKNSFKLRELRQPTFIVTAAPSWNKDSLPENASEIDVTVAINDPDWTIVESDYRLLVQRVNDENGPYPPAAWTKRKTTPSVSTTTVDSGLTPLKPYDVSVYASLNMNNVFPYDKTVPEQAYDEDLINYLQKAIRVTAVDATTVSVGDVTAAILANNQVQLTFDKSINLNEGSAPYIQYSLTPVTGSGAATPLTTASFKPTEVGSGVGAYKTFTLPGINITASGKYYIEYRLLDSSYSPLPGADSGGTLVVIK